MAKQNTPTEHRARKRFGQNFLVDEGIIRHIVRSIHPKEEHNIVEIGPGQGAITAPLLDACSKLNVIELDRDLVPILLAQFAKYPDAIVSPRWLAGLRPHWTTHPTSWYPR